MKTEVKIPIERTWVSLEPCVIIHAKKTMAEMPEFFREAFGRLYAYASSKAAPKQAFARYYDWSTDPIDFDAGVVIQKAIEGKDDIQPGRYGGHEALMALHVGPYGQIETVYNAIQAYLKEHELESGDAPYEVYLNSPDEVPESELKTEVYWPLK